MEKLKKFCKHSLTVAWGYLQILGAGIVGGFHAAGAYANDISANPSVKEALTQFNSIPKWVMPALVLFGFITVSARIHSMNPIKVLNNDPIPKRKK